MSGPSTWKIDSSHTNVGFAVRHLLARTARGPLTGVAGTLVLDREPPATSVDTDNEMRDNHLRSGDFFEAEKYPHMTFVSTKVEGAGGDRYHVHGDLTIKGVTRAVVLDAEVTGFNRSPYGFNVVGFEAKTKINRGDFGLGWNTALETGGVIVGEEVRITLDIEACEETA
ncbi:MAG: YceI family protein [Chloroflexi bacterium]|nr:YceI family protein [Chloroflexota bacterium]